MRVSPPNKRSDGPSPSQDPMNEKELGKQHYSSCLLLELALESPYWEPPVGSMAQASSWALLLPTVATWREERKQRGRRRRGDRMTQVTSCIMHSLCLAIKDTHTASSSTHPRAHDPQYM